MPNKGSELEELAAFLLRLRSAGQLSHVLVSALEATPRSMFLPGDMKNLSWSRRTIPIACGETIEGADMQALTLAALDLQPGQRVLEIGTGTGYTAAVMARIVERVTTLECYQTLIHDARQRFEALDLRNVIVKHVDGSNGLAGEGPFDRIIVWAAFETLPRAFLEQLSSHGILIAAVGPGDGEQILSRMTKIGSRFERLDLWSVRFQPLHTSRAKAL
ncbi:protein-L-isoaspartate(D-aspartate) O-methyltransferase [Limoniibacter endophyticus]|uniref:Protein-L-isoaspartate O-methyltransferase n=1 Tax=Limoniibacter endophyticus TaxID=1565040 RepID=A0A8J3GEV5_9HYPH|nr:protein-L-isoaspartate(D-aspartate) O-methyltransferase [Limoniibacter endophyticus]GHC62797.1 protein-L-isoaspartate O-methyltransferase [Limoniibacter endophyticus]